MLPKGPYNPNKTEEEILKYWLDNDFFKPEYRSDKKLSAAFVEGADQRETYTNILPPPNANGNLHLGHMSGYAYQDLMGRYNRMKGKAVLLLPGKDHAGIQTEVVFEKLLEKKGKSKKDLGRKKFYDECYKFCMKNSETARKQEKKLGLSADFDRELFTLDPKIVEKVLGTFIDLYDDGLVYRDKRLINWCVRCQTALADIDTEYKESEGKLYYFKYGFLKPDSQAIEIKEKFSLKEIEATVERYKGMDHSIGDTKFKWPFDYYGYIEGEINPADNENLDAIILGYENLKKDDKVKGIAVGMMLRMDKDYKLIIVNPESKLFKNRDFLKKKLDKLYPWFEKYFAGVHFRYFDEHKEDKYYNLGFILATTRPETKFGDTALCVNPKDSRYADWIGKEVEVRTLIGTAKVSIIADNVIDPDFGTGIMKVTPAHAPDDWDIATRHPEILPEKQCIGFDGKLNHICGKYQGMKVKEAKKTIEKDMKKNGMLVKLVKNYKNRIQICERCKSQIEPLISHQWFVDTKPLKEKAKQLVKDDFTNIMPDGKENVYLNWMNAPEDLCITRQLWWGYRVPVWYKIQPTEFVTETGEVKERFGNDIMHSMKDYKEYMKVQVDDPGNNWVQDEDVFDTWFSSGQWPVVTLLARDSDFEKFYPTQTMETGWDILIFWVTRMMLLCPYKAKSYLLKDDKNLDLTDKQISPFENVYLHGLVLDKNGVKMSKSKGNGIDPFKMMQEFGTDALRLSFVIGNKVGQNYRLYEEKIESFRNYCNKIWNISKFTLMNIGKEKVQNLDFTEIKENLQEDDKTMLKKIDSICKDCTRNMDNFNFGVVAQELYESIWHEFADIYLETIKPRIYTKDKQGNPINTSKEEKKSRQAALWTLWYCLDKYLRLLHPFIPFITERIWQELPKNEEESETLMYAKWPTSIEI